MLVNVAYIGHWIHKGAIVQFNNHEGIIPLDLFMYAYNRLSPVDFYGEPNPQYVPYRPWIRHNKDEREEPKPTYAYLAYTDDLPEYPHRRLTCSWATEAKHYKYQLAEYPYRSNVWNIKASIVDGLVDEMLLERLHATTIDEALWQTVLASLENVDQADVRRAQARYEAAEHELEGLRAELNHIQSNEHKSRSLVEARPVLELIIQCWDDVPREEKRDLFEQFARYIKISKVTRHTKHITVHWRDGSISERSTTHKSTGYFWDEDDLAKLCEMIETGVDQWEILRAFLDYTWRSLQERYAYKFGNGRYSATYTGKKPYNRSARWCDTAEYQVEQPVSSTDVPQLAVNSLSTDRLPAVSCGGCGRSLPPRSGSPTVMDSASGGRLHRRR